MFDNAIQTEGKLLKYFETADFSVPQQRSLVYLWQEWLCSSTRDLKALLRMSINENRSILAQRVRRETFLPGQP